MNEQIAHPQALDDSVDEFCYRLAVNLRRILSLNENEETDDETDDE